MSGVTPTHHVSEGSGLQTITKEGRFILGENLGCGTFSVVKLATHAVTNKKVAVKMLSKKKINELGTEERVQREMDSLRLCAAHPHIIRLYDVVESPTDIVLVIEYVSGGELCDYISSKCTKRLPPDEARSFFQQIISAVEYLHYKKIVHRDLKLENILLDANHVNIKLADFGLSNLIRPGENMRTPCGSPHYAAPEVISGKSYNGAEVDVWSCGVILYGMLCGALPFNEPSIPNQFKKIKSGTYSIPNHVSTEATDLIQRMLQVDPKKRITIAEIRQHPWFNHKLPPYLRLPPEMMEKQERQVVDSEVIDEVLRLYSSKSVPPQNDKVTREHVERAVAHKENVEAGDTPGITRNLRVAYELLLDDKHGQQRAREVAATKPVSGLGRFIRKTRRMCPWPKSKGASIKNS